MHEEINKTAALIVGASHDPTSTSVIPSGLTLVEAYPNPFNSSTCISYNLDRDAVITLKLFDLSGREVATLVNGKQLAGKHSTNWNAENMPSGSYLLRLSDGKQERTTKLLLVR